MTWGGANRPKVSNQLSIPHRSEGNDGDIQIRQTNLGAKLFGKIGGRWSSTFLSSEDEIIGTSGTKIGMNSSGTFTVNEINLTGKITLASKLKAENICIGVNNPDAGNGNILLGVDAGKLIEDGALNNICIGGSAGAALTTEDYNLFIGAGSGGSATGTSNVGIGHSAGQNLVGSDSNVFIGKACV